MIAKKHIYGKRPLPPNTFIGGVAGSLSTKNLLAAKLGIASTKIKSFKIVNDEVQAYIEGNYNLPADAFNLDTTITSFKDNDRLVQNFLGNGVFDGCSNLEVLELHGLKSFSAGGFPKIRGTKIQSLYFPEMLNITGNSSVVNNPLLTSFDAPIATTMGNNQTLANNVNLAYINIPNVINKIGIAVNTDSNSFGNCKAGCVINVHLSMMTINGGLPEPDLSSNMNLDVNYVGYITIPTNFNTEIGGVATTLGSRFLLGKTLGIGSARVVDYSTDGTTVKCRVLGSYNLPGAFLNNPNITFYKDNSGLCTQLNNNAFSNAANLTNVYFPSTITLNSSSGGGTGGVFNDCPKLHTVTMPMLINVNGRRNFANTPLLTSMNFDNVTSPIGLWTFQGSGIEHLSLPLVTSLGQEMFSINTLTKTFNAPVATVFAIRVFENARGLETINIPAVENIPIKNQNFIDLTSLNVLNAKKLKYMGDPSSINGGGAAAVFSGLKANCVLQVHIAMSTVNAGSADASLVWAKANRAAIVEFYDNDGNYVSTL